MNKLEAALALAKKGFRVFPLAPNTKVPPKGFTDFSGNATVDEEKIKDWWAGNPDFNIGISTDEWLVLDIDVKRKDNGFETLNKLATQGKVLPKTTEQLTISNGAHIIYKAPHPVHSNAGKIGPGLDVRGKGGYIVAMGSMVNGRVYKMNARPPVPAPEWLVKACDEAKDVGPARAHEKVQGIDLEAAKARGRKYLQGLPTTSEGGRNEAGYKVAARLKDMGCDKDDALLLMMSDWKCEPMLAIEEVKHVVNSAYHYGKNPQGADSVEALFESPTEETEEDLDPVSHLNKEYAFVRMKGSHRICMETTNEKGQFVLDHLQEDTFHKNLAMRTFQTGDGKIIPLTKHWMRAHNRRTYSGLVFAPEEEVDPRFYNLWRGFSVEPLGDNEPITDIMKKGVALFEEHLFNNICDGNIGYYNWVYGWFAHLIQKPWEKPETALVLKGRKGVGKNVLFDCVGSLFIHNYMVTAKKRHLIGNFNGHLENKILLVLDEALWGGNKEDDGILKALITEKETEIERKGFESYSITSRLRVAVLGNEDWLVPASDDERRYAVFNVGEDRRKDTAFFTEMMETMKAGANRYLLTKLKAFDLSKINVRLAPDTEGLQEQKLNSLSPVHEWWYDCLFKGYVTVGGFSEDAALWKTEVPLTDLLDAATDYIKQTKGKVAYLNSDRIFKAIKEVVPDAGIKRNEKTKVLDVVLPSLEKCRRSWDESKNMKIRWGV